jgi:hypothetical protein
MLIFFGGAPGNAYVDPWAHDGFHAEGDAPTGEVDPSILPSSGEHGAAYDPVRDAVIVLGGPEEPQ